MASAKLFGLVIHRPTGAVCQIYNPDHDFQLDLAAARLAPDQFMIRLSKKEFGISEKADAMTAENVYALQKRFSA